MSLPVPILKLYQGKQKLHIYMISYSMLLDILNDVITEFSTGQIRKENVTQHSVLSLPHKYTHPLVHFLDRSMQQR